MRTLAGMTIQDKKLRKIKEKTLLFSPGD